MLIRFVRHFSIPAFLLLAGCAGESADPPVESQSQALLLEVSNGNFENGNPDGWRGEAAAVQGADVHSGRWSASLAGGKEISRTFSNLEGGKTYRVEAFVKATNGAAATIAVSGFDGAITRSVVTGSTSYQQLALSFSMVSPGASPPAVKISVRNGSATGSVFVDSVRVETAGTDRVANPGFEAGATDWVAYGSNGLVEALANVSSGVRSWELQSASTTSGARASVDEPQAEHVYALKARLKVSAGNSAFLGVKNHGNDEVSTTATSPAFANVQRTFTTGPSNTTATIYVYKPSSSGTGSVFIDDVELIELGASHANLLTDAGFESGSKGQWQAGGTTLVSSTMASSGTYSAEISGTGTW